MTQSQESIYGHVYRQANINMAEALELVGDSAETDIATLVKIGILAKKGNVFILAPKRVEKIEMPRLF